MRKISWFTALTALATLALSACGGSGCDTSFANSCGSTTGPPAVVVASVLLVSDSSTIPSDNSLPANLTAYVRDANNNFVANIPVVFTSSSGGLNVTQGTTDANGVATATVSTLADKTTRTITITATADNISSTATVDVAGTVLQIQGSATLTTGQTGTYTVTLNDSGAHGIPGTAVTVQVPSFLTASTTSLTTDNQGRATFTATGASSGSGGLTVTGLGQTATVVVAVNGNALTFTAPAPNTNIALNTLATFTVNYLINGAAQNAATIGFATTRGCFNPAGATCVGQATTASVLTNSSGNASVSVLSDNAGGATISAAAAGGASGQITAQFISTTGASIDVQPSVFTLAPNSPPNTDQQSTISAIVRDANNNLVTGTTVAFSLNDVTGGTLSVGSAVTDLQGRAQTVYTAGTITSAANGVHVTATLQGAAIAKTVDLTVAKRQVFISIGTGNAIIANAAKTQYEKDYIVQVTDSNGAGVAGVSLSMSVLSNYYFKGYRTGVDSSGAALTNWLNCYTFPSNQCLPGGFGPTIFPPTAWGCADEDTNRNGILDPGEDISRNGRIDAGNIALVAPSTVLTDQNGFAPVSVFYPEEYAYWLLVTLQAQASVQGTAFSAQSTFMLPGLKDDFLISASPPGPISPFGQSNSCTDAL